MRTGPSFHRIPRLVTACLFLFGGSGVGAGLGQETLAGTTSFPLRVGADRRHLVDASGRPFPVVGDTAWSLVAQLRESEIVEYLDDRRRRGFNAIIVNLIERKFADRAPANIGGVAPFRDAARFGEPNPDYFDVARRAIEAAGRRGISVWLCPAYLGWVGGDEGFFREIRDAGPAALRAYGRFVGDRFKDLPNIVWMPGGDYALPESERWAGDELARGLREGGATQIMTAHGGQTSAVATFGDAPWLEVESVYRYQEDLWRPLQAAWRQKPTRPFVMVESAYEGEHKASPARIRAQAWWSVLSGAAGQFFGNNPVWYFDGPGFVDRKAAPTWRQALDLPGSRDMSRLAGFLAKHPWPEWIPDLDDRLIVVGAGEGGTRCVAARSADGSQAVVYLPSEGRVARAITVDLTLFPSAPTARWFNPAVDESPREQAVTDGGGRRAVLRSPGDNGTGASDWVLILESRGSETRLDWWREGRFGMFVHWGPSSLSGKEISWSRIGHPHDHPGLESVPASEYDQLYRRFDPVKFDAEAWMRLAKDAGMKYVVFTTKHHDGFSMWPTKLRPDYSISATPFRRDVCRELADAAHRLDLKLGWYYSTRDWTHPDYLVGDNAKYDAFYRGQVEELLSQYGRVDLLWFDHVAGNWRDYRFRELFEMMERLQPGLLVNNRAAAFIRPTVDQPGPGIADLVRGDFDTPEQRIGVFQNDRPWESCVTLTECADGGGWSYRPDGRTRRFDECLRMLVNCASGDGNLLLNVGPLPTGEIATDQQEVLRRVGAWLSRFGESIYATRGGPFRNGEWGGSTYRDRTIYLHVLKLDGPALRFPPLRANVVRAAALTGGTPSVKRDARGLIVTLPADQRDPLVTVLKLELDAPVAGEFVEGRPLKPPENLGLQLDSPLDYQVFQRGSPTHGVVRLVGRAPVEADRVEVRLETSGDGWAAPGADRPKPFTVEVRVRDGRFDAEVEVSAGGWYVCRVRAMRGGMLLAEAEVPHVGVGEVFVIAGQSNSANHGEERLSPRSGRVAAFDGTKWRLANDPQPGASGDGGSFLPPFGDAMAERFRIPIGLAGCGIGATSVREWLPSGSRFPNPPTLVGRVRPLPNGEWESKGEAFATFVARMKALGPRGFRAVLWHQGESDANQADPTRTLPGPLYRQYLGQLIRDSRAAIGWEAPWFVAQVSYHVPGDESSPEIRAAQAASWRDGVALEGPDTDAIKGEFRDGQGRGVHFSGPGQREHARRWVDKVAPWLEDSLGR